MFLTDWLYGKDQGGYFRTYLHNEWVKRNAFIGRRPEEKELPQYGQSRSLLPIPIWDGHSDLIACYWRSWEIAFGNLRQPEEGSGFIANYIDPAFNGNLFMWDSVFMLMFGGYGNRAFRFQETMDNFYAKQHPDGFICREINETTGEEQFHRYDPSSTGPNLLAWSEWLYFQQTGDKSRLSAVFPVIAGYHRWMRRYRTWQDGGYYSTGWGCGMDNQPRIPGSTQLEFDHGHMTWVDVTFQHLLSAKLLVEMAALLGCSGEAEEFRSEAEALTKLVNDKLWDEEKGFYFDKHSDGSLSDVMSIGSFWALLSGAIPPDRLQRFISHLSDPATFNRPHRVPTLAANAQGYRERGDYWRGSIWAPTNYMVLKGLEHTKQDELAHEIALNHVGSVCEVYRQTGTLWENYAPEVIERGELAALEFVGWTGVSTITVLLEFVIGLKRSVTSDELVWDIRLTEGHGAERYPIGEKDWLSLYCEARPDVSARPVIRAASTAPIKLMYSWQGGSAEAELKAGETVLLK